MIGDIEALVEEYRDARCGILTFQKTYEQKSAFALSESGSLTEAATSLFSAMRKLDSDPDVDIILTELFPEKGLGRAINDRLQRAATP